MATDEHYMQLAIDQANKAGPETWLNPKVGAVIVKNDQILASGHTHQFGSIHAERDAISKLSPEELFHSTLYVTLEPCNHFGKQPPCSQLIVNSKISRVVVGQTDPNPLVTGKGIRTLQRAGIKVVAGVLDKEARQINPHYSFFFEHKRPWITIKQAISLDAKVTAKRGQRTAITNQTVYKRVHAERAYYNGIIIGSQTALIDDPSLLTSLKSSFPPIRIILDRRGRLGSCPQLRLLNDNKAPTWIFTANHDLTTKLADKAVKVFADEDCSIKNVVEVLAAKGLQGLYVEGGPTIEEAFLNANLCDELLTYISPQLIGQNGVKGLQSSRSLSFDEVKIEGLNGNIRVEERKHH